MVKTVSSMVPLGTSAPEFSLPNPITGELVSLSHQHSSNAVVVTFICNHCPYVKHISHEIVKLHHDYQANNILFYAINSNDVSHYPDDSPEHMQRIAQQEGYLFPYLFDETQEVARAYQATCTPDFFVYDRDYHLVYRGQFDDSRPGNHIKPSGNSIRLALNCILNNQAVPQLQKSSIGCNIKWKAELE